jgi:hypothetical protein
VVDLQVMDQDLPAATVAVLRLAAILILEKIS